MIMPNVMFTAGFFDRPIPCRWSAGNGLAFIYVGDFVKIEASEELKFIVRHAFAEPVTDIL